VNDVLENEMKIPMTVITIFVKGGRYINIKKHERCNLSNNSGILVLCVFIYFVFQYSVIVFKYIFCTISNI